MIDEWRMMSSVFFVYVLLPVLIVLLGATPGQGDLRLQGGGFSSGRLEIFYNREWGTVCGDNFGEEEARVVCRELGLDTSVVKFFNSSKFGQGNGTIWLDEVNCNGWESTLESCSYNSFGDHDCTHSQDVGILCGEYAESGDLRLRGDDSTHGGRLEIFHNGEWGTVCDDDFDEADARVACRQLGLESTSVEYFDSSKYGEGTGTIWLDQLHCIGWEWTLESCNRNAYGDHDCTHAEDVGISCGTGGSDNDNSSSFWGGFGRYMGSIIFVVVVIVACAGSMYRRRQLYLMRQRQNNGAFVQGPATGMVHVPPSTNNPGAAPVPVGTHAPPPQTGEPRPYPIQMYSPVYPPASTGGAPSSNPYPVQAYPHLAQNSDGQASPYPTQLPPVESSGPHQPQGDAVPYPSQNPGNAPPVYPPQSNSAFEGDLPPPPSYNDIVKQ